MKSAIKNQEQIKVMREGGKILAETLNLVTSKAKPGISTFELDSIAEQYIISKGAIPSFKGYQGFPATTCMAVNEVIVHGIPRKDIILKEGDIFTVDCGVLYKGLHTDAARSIGIGKIDKQKQLLIDTAKEALNNAISIAKPGLKINELGKIIQETIEKNGFYVIFDLTGHGIGKDLHEEPTILNYWDKKATSKLKEGMTIAIEPIFSAGSHDMITLDDGWTIVTSDSSYSVQQENTILITKSGNEILTELENKT